eukprot:CAMPEP_0115463328 /NCGR_PEP_ID=MMETSP0271-20121206/48291_1 /TAXON_ID=71861 /ORGANISM="Scrippsiella trochoidea, Strain CCMP3099" /LENGTH=432 /DNA_ID=CAMNT_0002890159 /DNA_START=7 /DNA_END=1302 /DNA_ORIENTATION=-
MEAWDASDWLASEAKLDAAAVEPAQCWCKEFGKFVDARISAANNEIEGLGSSTQVQHYENQQLQVTVAQHEEEANGHASSLDQADSLADRETGARKGEVEQLEQQLQQIQNLKAGMQSGTGAWTTIDHLEDTLKDHIKDAKASKDTSTSNFAELRIAKERMLRLSREAAAAHKQRLAAGLATLERARAELTAYSARREADIALSLAVQDLCSLVESSAAERQQKRQTAMILSSEVKVEQAQHDAMQAASSIMLLSNAQVGRSALGTAYIGNNASSTIKRLVIALQIDFSKNCPMTLEHAEDSKRLATQALDGAKQSAVDLMAFAGKGGSMQSALELMLHDAMTSSLNAETKVGRDLKSSFSELYEQAKSHLQALAPPFEVVGSKSKASSLADQALTTQLLASRAAASQVLVDAERCHDGNTFVQRRATKMLR